MSVTYFGNYSDLYDFGDYFGEYADDFDLEAIRKDYRSAICAALPDGFHLEGTQLVGPDGAEWPDMKAITESIDFPSIVGRHEKA